MIALPEAEIVAPDPERRRWHYKIDGQRYQRVSTILNVINKPKLTDWAVGVANDSVRSVLLNEDTVSGLADVVATRGEDGLYEGWVDRLLDSAGRAADEKRGETAERGTHIHEDIQQSIDLDLPAMSPEGAQALEYLKAEGIGVMHTELTVWHPEWGIAGTIDALGMRAGQVVIWDWKTGSGPWPEMALQLAAYAAILGYHGHDVSSASIVKLRPDGYSVHQVADLDEARSLFEAAMELQRGLRGVTWQ